MFEQEEGFEPTFSIPITINGLENRFDYTCICGLTQSQTGVLGLGNPRSIQLNYKTNYSFKTFTSINSKPAAIAPK